MSRPLKIWLIEYGGSISTPSTDESERVRRGLQQRLQQWYQRVVTHASARSHMPRGFERRAQVAWATRLVPTDVSAYDLVIHFDQSSVIGTPNVTSPFLGPYNAALRQLDSQGVTAAALQRAPSGGLTRVFQVNDSIVPILSVVYVLYDAQMSSRDVRVSTNVESLSLVAFHESAHNKDRSNSLHTAGGGGIFADIHTSGRASASQPNGQNIGFFAERIWNWGPQYIDGQTLTPVRPPAP